MKESPDNWAREIHYLTNDLFLIGIFYLQAYVFIPFLIYRKKYSLYGLVLAVIFTMLVAYRWFFTTMVFTEHKFEIRPTILFNIFVLLFILAASTAYIMIKERMRAERLQSQRENETLKTELSFLRSQASPHFMFNVLNNMVALARKKSDQLEPSLIKLSSLLRYMLYETDEDKVPLDKETEYLQSYIDLQRQRFGQNVRIDVLLAPGDFGYEIEPMLLIPFVENAFKHGTGMILDAHIDIRLRLEGNELLFAVTNKYNPASIEVKDKTSGIGLNNVKRRLNLLYAKNHTLTINKDNDRFAVSLKINLR